MDLLSRRPAPSRPLAVVLCAGGSTRMGTPKGLLALDGVPLLRAHVDALRAVRLDVTVVLGLRAAEHVAVLPPGVRVVLNLRWSTTEMADSAYFGLEGAGIALLTPVDVPPARADTLAALLAVDGPAVPTWEGRPGHPVRLEAPHPRARLEDRLRGARAVAVTDPDCTLNLNRPEDWQAWLATRGPG